MLPAGDPARAIWCQAAAWHHTVEVGMVVQLLAPGMEDRQKANVSTEMHGIPRNSYEGLGDCLEEEGIEETGVLEGKPMERVGEGKDDMEVGHLEELSLSGGEPGSLRHP